MIKIYLVRHGETDYNSQNLIQGSTNANLTKQGKLQAHKVGEALADINFDCAYSGSLNRQKDTASIILEQNNFNKPIINIDNRFNEIDYGKLEGADQNETLISALKNCYSGNLSLNDILGNMRAKQLLKLTAEIDSENGVEDDCIAYKRYKDAMEDAAKGADDFSNILIVSSGAITTQFLEEYFLEDGKCLAHVIPNGGIICLEYDVSYNKFNFISVKWGQNGDTW